MGYVGQSIFARLSGQSGVTSLVSNQIYGKSAPSHASFPYITFHKISEVRPHAMVRDPGIAEARIQVSTWSTDIAQADAIARQVRTALQDYKGSTGGIDIQRIFFDVEIELPSGIEPETVESIAHIAQDYIVWYTT